MHNKRIIKLSPAILYLFIVLWYSFFNSSSIILRPFVSIIWPGLAVIGFLFAGKQLKVTSVSYFITYTMLVLICLVSALYSSEAAATFKLLTMLLISLVLANFLVDFIADINKIMRFFFTFLLVFLSATFMEMLFPELYKAIFFPFMEKDAQLKSLDFLRINAITGFTTQTSVNAFWMLLGFTISWLLFLIGSTKKLLWFLISALFFVGIVATSRRAALLISLPILTSSIYLSIKNRQGRISKLLVIVTAIFIILFGIVSVYPESIPVLSKFFIYYNKGDVLNGRMEIYTNSWRIFNDHLFFGIGFNGFSQTYSAYYGSYILSHNSFLQLLCEFGILGIGFYLIPYLYCLSKTIKATLKNRNMLQEDPECYRLLVTSMLIQVIFLTYGLSESAFHFDTYFFPFFLFQKISMKIIDSLQPKIAIKMNSLGKSRWIKANHNCLNKQCL